MQCRPIATRKCEGILILEIKLYFDLYVRINTNVHVCVITFAARMSVSWGVL